MQHVVFKLKVCFCQRADLAGVITKSRKNAVVFEKGSNKAKVKPAYEYICVYVCVYIYKYIYMIVV